MRRSARGLRVKPNDVSQSRGSLVIAKYGRLAMILAGVWMTLQFALLAPGDTNGQTAATALVVTLAVLTAAFSVVHPFVRALATSAVLLVALTATNSLPFVWPPYVHQNEPLKFMVYAICLSLLLYAAWLQLPAIRSGRERTSAIVSVGALALGLAAWVAAYIWARLLPASAPFSGSMIAEAMLTVIVLILPLALLSDGLVTLVRRRFQPASIEATT